MPTMTLLRILASVPMVLAVFGCLARGPAPSTPTDAVFPPPTVEARLTDEQVLARATQLIEASEATSAYSVDADSAARALEAGATEVELMSLIEQLFADCLNRHERCQELGPLQRPRDDERLRAVQILTALLSEVGTQVSLPLLFSLDAHGLWEGDSAVVRQLERLTENTRAELRCAPPTDAEVSRSRRALDGFLVLRLRNDQLRGEEPTATELDDLAYFRAATNDALAAVGTAEEDGDGSWTNAGPAAGEQGLRTALEEVNAAKLGGNLQVIATKARAYLGRLGYPGPIQTNLAAEYAWGGARYSYVMRDLARATEALGELDEAAALYRRANPGGGACGTSVSSRWADQIRGVIRTTERGGNCRRVIIERLVAVDGLESELYGTAPLAAAGFDIVRLYRGALVARDRDIGDDALREALQQSPEPLRVAALARLERLGPEAWERRVVALEGLADAGQREVLGLLVDVALTGSPELSLRALEALGILAGRPELNPCTPNTFSLPNLSSSWTRRIRSLGRSCETLLPMAEADAIARRITPLLRNGHPNLREVAAQTLGALGSLAATDELRPLLEDEFQPEGVQVCTTEDGESSCRQPTPVREAAEAALARIERIHSESREEDSPEE